MKNNEFVKILSGIITQITNAGTGTASIDTLGFQDALVIVSLGATNTVSNVPTVFKLAENDDASTTWTNITECVGGGVGGFTLPTNMTTTATLANTLAFKLDLRARKRYLQLAISPVTTQTCYYTTILSRAQVPVNTAAERGVHNFVVA